MTLAAGRRRFVFVLAALGCARVAAQQGASRADGVGGRNDPGLRRLEAVLAKQLNQGKSALPLPWQETILKPDTARLVWRAHSLALPNEIDRFRVAIDPPTRWYYIGQTSRAGAPLTLYGPLEEGAKGEFIDALALAGAASPVVAPAARSAAEQKPKLKPKPKPKPKRKSSTTVKN